MPSAPPVCCSRLFYREYERQRSILDFALAQRGRGADNAPALDARHVALLNYLALILISALFGAEVFDPTEELYPTPVFGFLMALLFVAAWAHLRLRRRFNLSVMQRIIDLSEDPQKQHMLLGTEMRLRGVGATGWLEVAAILILVFVFRDSLDWDTVPLVAVWVALGLLTFLHEAFLKEASYDRIAESLGPPRSALAAAASVDRARIGNRRLYLVAGPSLAGCAAFWRFFLRKRYCRPDHRDRIQHLVRPRRTVDR